MLELNLEPLFKIKGIEKPIGWMTRHGILNDTAHKLLHNSFKRGVPIHHVGTICKGLYCTPNDVFCVSPKSIKSLPEGHPLQLLVPKEETKNINELLQELPPDKLAIGLNFLINLKNSP